MLLRNFLITRLTSGCLAAIFVLCTSGPAVLAWEFAHGDRDNSGFANVATAPAKKAPITVPGLGRFAPGAGPVIAPDGTVYLGTMEGKLIALHADGSPFWSRDITRGQAIIASPAVGADGSIYVIGVKKVRDNRVEPPVERVESTLYRFNSSGGWLADTRFPDHEGAAAVGAPPNIWRSGNAEVVIVPAAYADRYGDTVRLIAFSTSTQVLAQQVVTNTPAGVTGGWGRPAWMTVTCLIPPFVRCPFAPLPLEGPALGALVPVPPVPGVGVFTFAGGGTPFILVSDHYKDLVAYTFSGNSFNEIFRVHQEDFFMRTPPVTLPNGHTLIGMESIKRDPDGAESVGVGGRIIFAGPNMNKVSPVSDLTVVQAPPTRMADGRVALVDALGKVVVLQSGQIVTSVKAPGRSIASAAASRTHLFVSAENGFVTYDTNSLAEIARIDWVGGGRNPPAIGPKGHVYAIASNILFVFPPPKQKPAGATVAEPGMPAVAQPGQPSGATVAEPGMPVATDPGQPTAQPASQSYKPPMTVNGNRLFACEELDQDDCGKGDYRSIAKAFCEKQGYIEADDIDVDSKKVKAETLDGRFCSKNKCKVFERIVCAM